MSAVFTAKYDGVCGTCAFTFDKGEQVHYVNNRVAHEHCHNPDGSDFGSVDSGSEVGYIQRGKRPLPYCPTCFTYHNGECS